MTSRPMGNRNYKKFLAGMLYIVNTENLRESSLVNVVMRDHLEQDDLELRTGDLVLINRANKTGRMNDRIEVYVFRKGMYGELFVKDLRDQDIYREIK